MTQKLYSIARSVYHTLVPLEARLRLWRLRRVHKDRSLNKEDSFEVERTDNLLSNSDKIYDRDRNPSATKRSILAEHLSPSYIGISGGKLEELTKNVSDSIDIFKEPYYFEFYEGLFGSICDLPLNILEVGLYKGGSLLLLSQYFKNARLLSIDINQPDPILYDEIQRLNLQQRIMIQFGSQADPDFLDRAITQCFEGEGLDLVIDDASHFYQETKATYTHVFHRHLRSGGLYVIEDWGAGYWPKWPDGNPDGTQGLPRLIKELIDEIALEDRTVLYGGVRALPVDKTLESAIARMIVGKSIAALIKA